MAIRKQKVKLGLTGLPTHGTIQQRYGGVGVPVGLTVFKTAGGSLSAVPGGFDSHTPLPSDCVIFKKQLLVSLFEKL